MYRAEFVDVQIPAALRLSCILAEVWDEWECQALSVVCRGEVVKIEMVWPCEKRAHHGFWIRGFIHSIISAKFFGDAESSCEFLDCMSF